MVEGQVPLSAAALALNWAYLVAAGLSSVHEDNLGEVLATVISSEKDSGASDALRERLLALAAAPGRVRSNISAKLATVERPVPAPRNITP